MKIRRIGAIYYTLLVIASPCLPQVVSHPASGKLTEPAVCDGVVYFGKDNGILFGIKTNDGSNVPGFPVDVAASANDGSFFRGLRPSVYYGAHGKAIYIGTSKHGVAKVWPNGTVAWINKLDPSDPFGGYCTPAVTPQGEVIAQMVTGDSVFVVKLRESDGSLLMSSPPLAFGNFSAVTPPAVANGNIYITVWPNPVAGFDYYIAVLNVADLAVKAVFYGSGWDKTTPYIRATGVYVGSGLEKGATVFKLNSSTLSPDPSFGSTAGKPGVTWVLSSGEKYGEAEVAASPASADRDGAGTVYAGVSSSQLARVVAINAVSGAVRVLYDSGGEGGPGLVVSPKGVIAYGDGKALKLISVDGGVLKSYPLPGIPGRPCYDPTTNRFFVTTQPDGTSTSYLLGFDSP